LTIHISQGSVATQLRCGGIFNKNDCKLSAECASEIISKIDQYSANIWTMTKWEVFLGHSVVTRL